MSIKKESKTLNTDFLKTKPFIITVFVFLIFLITSIILLSQLSSMAEKELLKIANRELAPNAELEFGNLKLGIFPIKIAIHDIKLVHKEPFSEQTIGKPLDTIRRFELEFAELSGLQFFRMIRGREWTVGSLNMNGLNLDLIRTSPGRLTDSSPFKAPIRVVILETEISDINFNLFSSQTAESPIYSVDDLNLWVSDITVQDAEEPLHTYFNDFYFTAEFIRHKTEDGFYDISLQGLSADSHEKKLTLEKIDVVPLLTPYEIATKTGYETDVFNISGGPYYFTGFEIDNWIENNDIHFAYAELNDLSLEIERDKTFEREPRDHRLLPNRQLLDLPFSVKADSISWKNGLISYSEKYYEKDIIGTVLFNDVDINIKSVQNRDSSSPITVKAYSRFMDASDLNADFEFFVSEFGDHTITASLSSIDLKELNNPLENMAFVRVNNGKLHSLDFSLTSNDDISEGVMTLIYDDLGLRFLDDKTMEEGTRTKVLSFMANTFAVRSSNRNPDPRIGSMNYERDKDRSMFNFWWRSIQAGMIDTVQR
jgi:hypothetical protein